MMGAISIIILTLLVCSAPDNSSVDQDADHTHDDEMMVIMLTKMVNHMLMIFLTFVDPVIIFITFVTFLIGIPKVAGRAFNTVRDPSS